MGMKKSQAELEIEALAEYLALPQLALIKFYKEARSESQHGRLAQVTTAQPLAQVTAAQPLAQVTTAQPLAQVTGAQPLSSGDRRHSRLAQATGAAAAKSSGYSSTAASSGY